MICLTYTQLAILGGLAILLLVAAYWVGRNDEYEKFIKHRMGEYDE